MRHSYNYITHTLTVFCSGCMATLILNAAPTADIEQAILAHGWDSDPEGTLCPPCHTLATQQASFKGIL